VGRLLKGAVMVATSTNSLMSELRTFPNRLLILRPHLFTPTGPAACCPRAPREPGQAHRSWHIPAAECRMAALLKIDFDQLVADPSSASSLAQVGMTSDGLKAQVQELEAECSAELANYCGG
jgi:hypothetical protein